MAAKKQVTIEALGEIRHDGAVYAEGDDLTMSESAAEALVAAGAAKPKGRASAEMKDAQKKAEDLTKLGTNPQTVVTEPPVA